MERTIPFPAEVAPEDVDTLVREAEEAVRLTAGQPVRAMEVARELQRRAAAAGDLEAGSVAARALGLAAKELGDLGGARTHLETAARLARRGELELREGEARTSCSVVLALAGSSQEALEEAAAATSLVGGSDAARLEVQRAAILQRLGRHDEAMRSYGVAVAELTRLGHMMEAAQVHTNRGILHAYLGNCTAATSDLTRARELYVDRGLELAAAEAHHNLGFVAARQGDIPRALACYDAAAEVFRRLGVARPAALLDRCEALLAVRLVTEALTLAERAVEQLEGSGMHVDAAEARLVLAQAALLAGDHRRALEIGEFARSSFVEQERGGWAALARYAVLRARWRGEEPGAGFPQEAIRTADELEAAGWAVPAADARLVAAQVALGRGLVWEAEAQLVAATAARRSGPAEVRARAWHAEALLRLHRRDDRSALAALRAGLLVLDQHQLSLGATELRVHAKSHATELATLGLRITLRGRRPEAVLAWAERWRAGLHRLPRGHPPENPVLAAALAELRKVVTDLEAAALDGNDTARMVRRQAKLESHIKRLGRHLPGPTSARLNRPASIGALGEALGECALVEFVELDGDLLAVTLVQGRARLRTLAPARSVATEVDQLRFSLRRLAARHQATASADASVAAAGHAGHRLDELLLGPVLADVGARDLVIVPTGLLHQLPWAILPSCRSRPVSVAPSATQWLLASQRPGAPTGSTAVLVAGPGCGASTEEIADVAGLVPGARALTGEDATVAEVSRRLDGAAMAHLVAHGTFRRDNPLFSSLQLADGPLTVYDLEQIPRVPPLVVLSACEGGMSAVAAGDELLGLASALLAFGGRAVVASVTPVPDDLTRRLMVEFHQRVAAGQQPATALSGAQGALDANVDAGDPRRHAVAGFTCFGAG